MRVMGQRMWVAALCIVLAGQAGAAVWYVDVDSTAAAPDGKSWARAFPSIQQGANAAAGDAGGGEVWVAEGSYRETAHSGTLLLPEGVKVYGGFAGNETSRDSRDPAARVTIIDASKSRGGSPAYHAVQMAGGTVLDGFTVTGGRATNSTEPSRRVGAGVFFAGSSGRITIARCVIRNNVATDWGGGIYAAGASLTLTDCVLDNNDVTNAAPGRGGGGLLISGGSTVIRDCTFDNGDAREGGAVYVHSGSPSFSGCVFRNNTATWGGAVFCNNGPGFTSSPSFQVCAFARNKATKGGAVYNPSSSTSFTNVYFLQNETSQQGGALYCENSPTFMNCSFAENKGSTGGALYNATTARPRLTNCILWNDRPSAIANANSLEPAVVEYSDVKGGYAGTGNINADPRFIGVGPSPLRLRPGSPCINAGTTSGAPSTDIAGTHRPHGSGVDMGAYEGPTCVLTVGQTGTGTVIPASGTYNYHLQNTQVTVKAVPGAGWRFGRWEGDASGTADEIVVTLNGDRFVRAVFIQQFTLKTESTPGGTITPAPGTYTHDTGTRVTVTAAPAEGWRFERWEGDVSGTQNPIEVTLNANRTVRAVFARVHVLSLAVEGEGSLDPAPGEYMHIEGEKVTLTATPDPGWRFAGWEGDATGLVNPLQITMDRSRQITAVFEEIPVYTLTVQKEGEGLVEPAPGVYEFVEGESVVLSATAALNWNFVGWKGSVTGTQNPVVLTMTEDKAVTASFEFVPLEVGDFNPKLGLVIGGTSVLVDVGGWNSSCRMFVGDTPCLSATPLPGNPNRLRVVVPALPEGTYKLVARKSQTSEEVQSAASFRYTANPFDTSLAENWDGGVTVEDGKLGVTTYGRRAQRQGGVFPTLVYQTPGGVTVEISDGALPPAATAVFLLVRSGNRLRTMFPSVAPPEGDSFHSGGIDLKVFVEQGGVLEVTGFEPQPAVLRFQTHLDPDRYPPRLGTLDTAIDAVYWPLLPDPPDLLDTGLTHTVAAAGELVYSVGYPGAFTVFGPAPKSDVNGDGIVDAVDVQLTINGVLGLDTGGRMPDVNDDGFVNAVDVQLVINAVLGVGTL